jgi:heat shock protein HslJ
MKLAILVTTAFTLITTLKDADCEAVTASTPIYNTKWILKKVYTAGKAEDINLKTAFIIFNAEKKSAGGKGGCNSFGSSFVIDKENISIKEIFSTKMYCEGIQATEDAFLKHLGNTNRFEVKGKKLVLFLDNDALLEFESE